MDLVAAEDRERISALFEDACLGKAAIFYFNGAQNTYSREHASDFILLKEACANIIKITGMSQTMTKRKEAEHLPEEHQQTLSTLMNHLPGVAYRCLNDRSWTMKFMSEGVVDLTQYRVADFLEDRTVSWGQLIRLEDRDKVWTQVQEALQGRQPYMVSYRIHTAGGQEKWVSEQGEGVFPLQGQILFREGFITDITARKQAEGLLEGEKTVLGSIARGAALKDTLNLLCQTIEEHCPGIRSSLLVLEGTTLRRMASPNMPEGFMQAIDGMTIGPCVGSCGTASYRRELIMVSDIATDSLWVDYRDLALSHDLRSCWSMPIVSTHDRVLGTFAMYDREARRPRSEELKVINFATNLARNAIERSQMEEALKQAHQLAALSTVASGLAHEIGTPMNIILGRAELLIKKASDDSIKKRAGHHRQTS